MKTKEQLTDFRGLTAKQLSVKITEARKKLVTLNQDKILGKIKNVHEITIIRKNVARMSTIMDEKISAEIK